MFTLDREYYDVFECIQTESVDMFVYAIAVLRKPFWPCVSHYTHEPNTISSMNLQNPGNEAGYSLHALIILNAENITICIWMLVLM